jgi:hypothetical protein
MSRFNKILSLLALFAAIGGTSTLMADVSPGFANLAKYQGATFTSSTDWRTIDTVAQAVHTDTGNLSNIYNAYCAAAISYHDVALGGQAMQQFTTNVGSMQSAANAVIGAKQATNQDRGIMQGDLGTIAPYANKTLGSCVS